jgi:hypothetical protein
LKRPGRKTRPFFVVLAPFRTCGILLRVRASSTFFGHNG